MCNVTVEREIQPQNLGHTNSEIIIFINCYYQINTLFTEE